MISYPDELQTSFSLEVIGGGSNGIRSSVSELIIIIIKLSLSIYILQLSDIVPKFSNPI